MSIQIIGAGPAGLSLGYYVKKKNISLKIYEASSRSGGNCKTLQFGEFKYDTGAHRFHNKNAEATTVVRELLKKDLIKVDAPSQIYFRDKKFDFPLQVKNLFSGLSAVEIRTIVFENFFKYFKIKKNSDSFKAKAYASYGKTLAELFLINYTEKLWGKDASLLDDKVAGDRLKGLDLSSLIKNAMGINDIHQEHLDGAFYYPKNGYGAIFEALHEYVGDKNIELNAAVSEVHHKDFKVDTIIINGKKEIGIDTLVSTLPINILIKLLRPAPPREILKSAKRLKFRSLRLAIVSLNKSSFSKNASIYYPEKQFDFTRIYEPKNRSSAMAPEGKTCIVIEVPCDDQDSIYQCSDKDFLSRISASIVEKNIVSKGDIIDSTSLKMPYAYPLLVKSSNQDIKQIISYLEEFKNFYFIGRNAQFKYLHTHNLFSLARNQISNIIN